MRLYCRMRPKTWIRDYTEAMQRERQMDRALNAISRTLLTPASVLFAALGIASAEARRAGRSSIGWVIRRARFARVAGLVIVGCISGIPTITIAAPQQQTIVFMRHGEKPPEGLGQLDCQGLNRALALPQVLKRKFGRPDYIFAPDPRQQVVDQDILYYYIRPLATIEPTAIRFDQPVSTKFGYQEIDGLQRELSDSQYYDALIFVAWEHKLLVELVRNLFASAGGNPSIVPDWDGSDFDSLYVLRFTRGQNKASVKFTRRSEGLNNQPTTCPR
jgi:hypothetical protein